MILAFSFGDNVVNHFASLCCRISVWTEESAEVGEYARLYPAVRAGLGSYSMLAGSEES